MQKQFAVPNAVLQCCRHSIKVPSVVPVLLLVKTSRLAKVTPSKTCNIQQLNTSPSQTHNKHNNRTEKICKYVKYSN